MAAAVTAATGTTIRSPGPTEPSFVGASVDSTWIAQAGIPVVTFGPGEMRVAHGPDECVAVDQLVGCAKALALGIAVWWSGSSWMSIAEQSDNGSAEVPMRRTGLVFHERCLWHDPGPHASVIPAGGFVEPDRTPTPRSA